MSENKRTDPAAAGPGRPPHAERPEGERPHAEPSRGDGGGPAEGRPVPSVPRQAEPGERHRPAAAGQQVLPGEPHPAPGAHPGTPIGGTGWLPTDRVERLSAEWHVVQSGFVDDPGQACRQADALVEKAAALVAEAVAEQRRDLRADDSPAEDGAPDTESLRLAMQDYHRLLDRLLAA
ncbi:hypothetical protein [Kitasatospora sp. NPDC088346]|uniref:hypothetical protein n=1 Tax=Kitasatospora sp. NPDC088346 TaxID=3364073 RepID=UPI00382D0A9D